MAEFYVTYDLEDAKFLAIVVAPQAPSTWQFSSREELIAAMESLEQEWQLLSEIPLPENFELKEECRDELAELRALRDLPKPDENLASQANLRFSGTGGSGDG